MANMTIENIGNFMQSGNLDRIMDRGQTVTNPVAPEIGSAAGGSAGASGAGTKSFSEMLNESVDKVNDLQLQADRAAKELVAGRNKNIHETMMQIENADMSFRLMMQVRNKVIEAYREIMRMQV